MQRLEYGCFQFLDHFAGRKRGVRFSSSRRIKFYKKLSKQLETRGKGKIIPLERRANISLEEFKKEYVAKRKPVVLEGAAKDWDSTKNWTLDYFKDLHGKDEIVMVDQINIADPYQKMTLAELIDGIHKGTGKYYRFYPLLERHPEHILDFDYKWLQERRTSFSVIDSFQVFMGGDQTITNIHNASQCNLFTQVEGEKEWRFYHYKDTAIIDPAPARNVYREAPYKTEKGPFDPFNPDFSGPYKLYEYLDSYSTVLKPGDVLWNPSYYWHAVKNHGNSIGVGYRWLPPAYCFSTAPLYALLDCFVTNPPVWKAHKLSKKDVNLVQMAESGQLKKYFKEETK